MAQNRKWWQWILDPVGVWDSWGKYLSGKNSFGEAFYGNGSVLGDLARSFGKVSNDVSGATESMQMQDTLNDENAQVAHQNTLEQMQYQSQLNSVGTKAGQMMSAGLNPALAGGVSNSVGGASAQMSNASLASGNALGSIGSLAVQLAEARNLDADTKLKTQQFDADLPTAQWLGYNASATKERSMAQYYEDMAAYERYKLEWEQKTENERIALMKSEENKNKALARYNNATAQEQEAMNTQLDEWIDLLPEQKRAELQAELAKAESIKDENERKNAIFWAKATALVAGGVCMFVPGAQGVGIALLSAGTGMTIAQK